MAVLDASILGDGDGFCLCVIDPFSRISMLLTGLLCCDDMMTKMMMARGIEVGIGLFYGQLKSRVSSLTLRKHLPRASDERVSSKLDFVLALACRESQCAAIRNVRWLPR